MGIRIILVFVVLLLLTITYSCNYINLESFRNEFQCSLRDELIPQYRTCPNMKNHNNKKTMCDLLKIQCNIKKSKTPSSVFEYTIHS